MNMDTLSALVFFPQMIAATEAEASSPLRPICSSHHHSSKQGAVFAKPEQESDNT
jgi:hypothetical protein